MPQSPINFTVSGLEPTHSPAWHYATREQKAAYMRAVRVLVLTEWDRQIASGIGANGKKLRALSPTTKRHRHSEMGPADPNAPPLIPAYGLSRTRSLVDARTDGYTVKVYWKFDPISGKRWGVILGYHRDGKGHLPKRNVFGLSAANRKRVLKAAHAWWEHYAAGRKITLPVRPRPGKAARPPVVHAPRVPKGPRGETINVTIGKDVHTMKRGAAAALLNATRAGQTVTFRSYQ
jgi:hypothetical protein